eukprot:gene6562-3214_t
MPFGGRTADYPNAGLGHDPRPTKPLSGQKAMGPMGRKRKAPKRVQAASIDEVLSQVEKEAEYFDEDLDVFEEEDDAYDPSDKVDVVDMENLAEYPQKVAEAEDARYKILKDNDRSRAMESDLTASDAAYFMRLLHDALVAGKLEYAYNSVRGFHNALADVWKTQGLSNKESLMVEGGRYLADLMDYEPYRVLKIAVLRGIEDSDRERIKPLLINADICTSKVCHAFRAGGAKAADLMGAPLDAIRRIGNWGGEVVTEVYATFAPKEALLALAGYTVGVDVPPKEAYWDQRYEIGFEDQAMEDALRHHVYPWFKDFSDQVDACITSKQSPRNCHAMLVRLAEVLIQGAIYLEAELQMPSTPEPSSPDPRLVHMRKCPEFQKAVEAFKERRCSMTKPLGKLEQLLQEHQKGIFAMLAKFLQGGGAGVSSMSATVPQPNGSAKWTQQELLQYKPTASYFSDLTTLHQAWDLYTVGKPITLAPLADLELAWEEKKPDSSNMLLVRYSEQDATNHLTKAERDNLRKRRCDFVSGFIVHVKKYIEQQGSLEALWAWEGASNWTQFKALMKIPQVKDSVWGGCLPSKADINGMKSGESAATLLLNSSPVQTPNLEFLASLQELRLSKMSDDELKAHAKTLQLTSSFQIFSKVYKKEGGGGTVEAERMIISPTQVTETTAQWKQLQADDFDKVQRFEATALFLNTYLKTVKAKLKARGLEDVTDKHKRAADNRTSRAASELTKASARTSSLGGVPFQGTPPRSSSLGGVPYQGTKIRRLDLDQS